MRQILNLKIRPEHKQNADGGPPKGSILQQLIYFDKSLIR
jgi:hypothetical protein